MKKRYYAQVARLRIETAFIEFDADEEEDEDDADAAQELAVQKIKQLANSEWRLEPFNGEDQAPFVMSIIDETEAAKLCEDPVPAGTVDPYDFVDAAGVTRFVLLSGNLDTGEGEVVGQPWLSDIRRF